MRRWESGRAAGGAGRHWPQELRRAAEVSWLNTWRRRVVQQQRQIDEVHIVALQAQQLCQALATRRQSDDQREVRHIGSFAQT